MHKGAMFNFNYCPCKCSNLALEKKVFGSTSATPDHEQDLEEDGCEDYHEENDVSGKNGASINKEVRGLNDASKNAKPDRANKLPNRLVKSAPTSRKESQHEQKIENDELETKSQKDQSNHTISATSTTFTDPTSSKSSLTPGDSFTRPKSKVSTKSRSEARERAENERREKQQGYSSSEDSLGSSSDESKCEVSPENDKEKKIETGINSLATTASIESTDWYFIIHWDNGNTDMQKL